MPPFSESSNPGPHKDTIRSRAGTAVRLVGYLFKRAGYDFFNDNVLTMAGALAYSTIFSVAPLLIISIAVAGFIFGDQASQQQIFHAIDGLIGTGGATAVKSLVHSAAHRPSAGIAATILGAITLLIGSTTAFAQLQSSLNFIWKVQAKPNKQVWTLVRQRLLTFSMVLVIAFLLLVSLVVSAALTAVGAYLGGKLPGGVPLWQAVNAVFSFGVITLLFAAIFKILPDVRLKWADVWIGAGVTALLFTIGKFLIGLYLGQSTVASTYGAAGSLVIFLLWVYFSSSILLFGAEFTRAYATRSGHSVPPVKTAEHVEIKPVHNEKKAS